MKDYNIIAVDFDGTLCENAWPEIGRPNRQIIDYVKRQQKYGAQIILWTCREGVKLNAAVDWCARQGLIFDAVNMNVPSIIKEFGGDCRKIYADVYIDDLSFNHRPFELRFEKSFETVLQEYVDAGYSVKIDENPKGAITIVVEREGRSYRRTLFKEMGPVGENDILFWLRDCRWHLDKTLRRKHEKAKNLNG